MFTSITTVMVRAAWAPMAPIDERLWPERHHRVFYLFKAFSQFSLQWNLAGGCFHSVPFDLVVMLLAEGNGAKGFVIRRLFVASFAVFAAECWSFILGFVFFFFKLFACLSGFSFELELV